MTNPTVSLAVVDPCDVWGTDLRMRLPSADDDAIAYEVRNTIQEFLQQSGALALDLLIDVVPGEDTYDYKDVDATYSPSNVSFGGLEGLYVHQIKLEDGSYLRLQDYVPYPLAAGASVPRVAWSAGQLGSVRVYPAPGETMAGQQMEFKTTLILVRPISTVPAALAAGYFDVILDGATGRMMSHSKRPYSDPKLGEYYLRRFRNGMRVATDEAKRGWMNAESSFLFNQDWSRTTRLRYP